MIPVSRYPAPPGPVGPVIAGPSETALPLLLSSGFFGRRQGCEPVSDALCRDSHEENHQIRLRDPSRQRRAASSDQSAFHRRRSTSSSRDSRDPLARSLFQRGSEAAASDVCIRCAIREHDLESTEPRFTFHPREGAGLPWRLPSQLTVTGWRHPLRDVPAEAPRIRGPVPLSLPRTPPCELGRSRARQAGRPRPASTRAPVVAMPVTRVAGEATRAGSPIRMCLLRACRGRAT
jgi:hypothetical protein